MRRILIVDDELLARQRIQRFLGELGVKAEVREAQNGLEALELARAFLPELMFLDVQMPGFGGFEVLAQLEERPFQVIFQTAFDEYALKAFDENACDYLLKPFSRDRFARALEKAFNRANHARPNLTGLVQSLTRSGQWLEKIAIRHAGQHRIVPVSEIVCFVSRDHVTCLHTRAGQEYVTELSIGSLQERLDPTHFARAHRSSVVNLSDVRAIGPTTHSVLELTGNLVVPLARSQRAWFLERYLS